MPRKNLIRTNLHYYHITTRSNHKDWFALPSEELWEISQKSFLRAQENNPADVSQYVLMGNHYHLLIKTPNEDIDRFMFWFNKTFSNLLRERSGKENRMFGSSYKWSLVRNERYLSNVRRYIYQNPIRAGLCQECGDYPYSTLYYKVRGLKCGFPLEENDEKSLVIDSNKFDLILTAEDLRKVRTGLRKTTFKPAITRSY